MSSAEILYGPAEIREKPGGTILYHLYKDTEVGCTAPDKKNWVRVLRTVKIHKDFFIDQVKIKSGASMLDSNLTIIGKVKSNHFPYRNYTLNGDYYDIEISGYVMKFAIKDSSIAENAFNTFFSKQKTCCTEVQLLSQIKKFAFLEGPKNKIYHSYVLMEAPVHNLSPGPRIILVFSEEKLIAILSSREIKVKTYEVQTNSGGYKMNFVEQLSEEEMKIFSTLYLQE